MSLLFKNLLYKTKNVFDSFFLTNDIINKKVLLSLSAGPDSSLCLRLLLEIKKLDDNFNFSIILFNHKLDTLSFFKEENYVTSLCKKMKIKLYKYYFIDEDNYSPSKKNYSHNDFRKFRIKKIVTSCYENDYKICVLGHNKEDLIDTFLMRLGKGSGFPSLNSINDMNKMYSITFFRPLLNISRVDIETLMLNHQYFLDSTRKNQTQRNSIRRIHKNLEEVGINLQGIYLSIQRQKQYYSYINDMMKNNLEDGYNYSIINNFNNLSHLEKIENIKLAMENINYNNRTAIDLMDKVIDKLQNNITTTFNNSLLFFNNKTNQLIITSEIIHHKLLKLKDNSYFLNIDKKQLKRKQWFIWNKKFFFLFNPNNIQKDEDNNDSIIITQIYYLKKILQKNNINLDFNYNIFPHPNILNSMVGVLYLNDNFPNKLLIHHEVLVNNHIDNLKIIKNNFKSTFILI